MSERAIRARTITAALLISGLWAGCAEAQSWQNVSSARQLAGDERPLDVDIRYGAGELTVAPAEASMLYQLEMRYDAEHFQPLTDYSPERGRLRLGAEGSNGRRMNIESGGHADVRLSREVPISLNIEFGAGEAELDLSGMRLRYASISTGASESVVRFDQPNPIRAERLRIQAGAADLKVFGLGNVRSDDYSFDGGVGSTLLDFSGQWDRDAHASIQLGVGKLVLRLPRGLGVRVNQDSFLTRFDSEGLVKRGDSYYSTDWDRADHQLTIDVNAAFGAIDVEWVD